ncbi:MAG: hypothetical protein K2Q11_06400 [Burkholderiaceae bacterium]|nr:hypothetical protein [Burkholderiaceae bacterium]
MNTQHPPFFSAAFALSRRASVALAALSCGLAIAATPAPQELLAPDAGPRPTNPTTPTNPAALSSADLALLKTYLVLDFNNLYPYATPTLPVHYDAAVLNADNTPAGNRISNAGATLGRVLFNDKRLSTTNTVACASCHQQASGFTDPQRFSPGVVPGVLTSAHSMRLGNVRFYRAGSMFWDKRAPTLEFQATQPIQNPHEMGFDAAHGGVAALITKMQSLPYYPVLFKWVYGSTTITEAKIQTALAQFERSMIAADSRWDAGYAKVYNAQLPDKGLSLAVPTLTAQENRGRQLFILPPNQGGVGCAGCHQPPTFSLNANSLSNGLDAGNTVIFKSPSLKNVGLDKAFMHDGRFSTLEQVVDHYDRGVKAGPALDNRLKTPAGQPRVLNLSAADKAALVAFMKTLTDTGFLTDARFSNPFNP